MTSMNIYRSLGGLDPDLIAKAAPAEKARKKKRNTWIKWVSLAACFALIVGGIAVMPTLQEEGLGIYYPPIKFPTYGGDFPFGDGAPDVYQTTFGFDSYKEMIRAFGKSDLNPYDYTIQELKNLMGEPYSHFVDTVNTDKSFPQPMLDHKPIPYRDKEGFSNITFFVEELYGLPWIWYYPQVSTGGNFYISMTYLPDSEKQRHMTAAEVIKELSPNSANIDNLGSDHERIYNKQIKLNDREVTALVMEYNDSTRDSIFFVYDDLLVRVRCDPNVWTEEWFSELSFGVYKR